MAKKGKHGKIILTPEEVKFLRDNFKTMTNRELAGALGLKLTKTREFLYEMGLKRMEMEYWTDDQIEFLKANYRAIGDTELAEIFEKKWPKNKTWTHQHIDKKRQYLKLKRTKEELRLIQKRNKELGCWAECATKMWATRGVAKIGEVRIWKFSNEDYLTKVLKTNSGFVKYAHYIWEKHYGKVPEGFNIVFRNGNSLDVKIENLECISNSELMRRNSIHNYPLEIKETIRLRNKITKQIKAQTK